MGEFNWEGGAVNENQNELNNHFLNNLGYSSFQIEKKKNSLSCTSLNKAIISASVTLSIPKL